MTDLSVKEIEGFVISALMQLKEAVILVDMNAQLLWSNSAADEIFGVSEGLANVDTREVFSLLFTEDDKPFPMEKTPLVRALLNREKVLNGRVKIKRSDGSFLMTSGNASPVYDETGKQLGAVLTVTDKTETYQAESELKQALEEKEALLLEINHRIKNSLQMVSSLISVQAGEIEDVEAKRAMADTERRIQTIAETHRALYQMQSHKIVDCISLLPNLCRSVIQSYSHSKKIHFVSSCSGEMVLPVSIATTLSLAVAELVTNCCKHAFDENSRSAEVTLKMRGLDKSAVIEVNDNGNGFDPSEIDPAKLSISGLLVSSIRTSLSASVDTETDQRGTRVSIRFDLPD